MFDLPLLWTIIASVIAVILAAGLNRMRGIGKGEFIVYGKLPAAIGIGLVATFFHGYIWGPLWAGAFLFWSAFAWGRWFDLGRLPENWNREGKEPNVYESLIEKVSSSDHIRFGIRHAFASPFLGILGGPIAGPIAAIAFPLAAVGCYEAGWRLSEKKPTEIAEFAVGALWGLLIVLTQF